MMSRAVTSSSPKVDLQVDRAGPSTSKAKEGSVRYYFLSAARSFAASRGVSCCTPTCPIIAVAVALLSWSCHVLLDSGVADSLSNLSLIVGPT